LMAEGAEFLGVHVQRRGAFCGALGALLVGHGESRAGRLSSV
jgi:hypothetical protein